MISNHATKSLSIQWSVYFVNENGDEIITQIIKPFEMEQIANNTTLVDPITGDFFTDTIDTELVDAIGEYDFYWMLVNSMPTQLPDLIVAAGNRFKTKVMTNS